MLRGDIVPTDEIRETNVIDLTAADDAADDARGAAGDEEPTLEHVLDGDDLSVIAADPGSRRQRSRRRPWLVVAEVAAVVLMLTAVALVANRNKHSGNEQVATAPETDANLATPTTPTTPVGGSPTTSPVAVTQDSSASSTGDGLPVNSPPAQQPSPAASSPVSVALPPAAPETTAPPQQTSPPSALQWSASPGVLAVPVNGVATLVVTVRNPSDGVVTLPTPLSCTPKLDGSGVCPQMTDTVQPHSQRAQMYKVSADGLAPGAYTLMIEGGLFSVSVTVTPAA